MDTFMTDKVNNIYQARIAFMEEVGKVGLGKGGKLDAGRTKYDFRKFDDLLPIINAAAVKVGMPRWLIISL